MSKEVKKSASLNKERLYQVIISPIVTEKTTQASEHNKFSFNVALDATKPEIKAAIEEIFKVKVKAVNTLRVKGKVKRFRGRLGQRSDRKKAVITLAEGSSMDIGSGI